MICREVNGKTFYPSVPFPSMAPPASPYYSTQPHGGGATTSNNAGGLFSPYSPASVSAVNTGSVICKYYLQGKCYNGDRCVVGRACMRAGLDV